MVKQDAAECLPEVHLLCHTIASVIKLKIIALNRLNRSVSSAATVSVAS